MNATRPPALEPLEKQQDETAAGFHQSWFPPGAGEAGGGQVMGRDFLGTRVILYRDATGKATVVQSAFCPHLGADLSVSEVVDRRRSAAPITTGVLTAPGAAWTSRPATRSRPGPHRDLSERGGVGPHLGVQRGGAASSRCRASPARRSQAPLRDSFPGHARLPIPGCRRPTAWTSAPPHLCTASGAVESGGGHGRRAPHGIPDRGARVRAGGRITRGQHVLAASGPHGGGTIVSCLCSAAPPSRTLAAPWASSTACGTRARGAPARPPSSKGCAASCSG